MRPAVPSTARCTGLASLEGVPLEEARRLSAAKFEYVVACQIYGVMKMSSKEVDTEKASHIDALRAAEAKDGRTPAGHVRALVLAPTSELAQQVLTVARAISAGGARCICSTSRRLSSSLLSHTVAWLRC